VRGGDPGLAVLMVPAGAAALFGGVLATVLALRVPASREARGSEPVPPAGGPATERERRSSEAEPA
jgi:hypothetical protein